MKSELFSLEGNLDSALEATKLALVSDPGSRYLSERVTRLSLRLRTIALLRGFEELRALYGLERDLVREALCSKIAGELYANIQKDHR